jgi:hypothetical protein
VLLAQDEIGGTMFERIGTDWVGHLLGRDTILCMPEIGIEVALAEFYTGIDLAPYPAAEASEPRP